MIRKRPAHAERSFGVSVGGVLCVIAAFLAWRGSTQTAAILGPIGLALVVLGIVHPPILKWPSAIWWRLAYALGYVNARIILTVLFAIVLVPVGVLWRIVGRDPLRRRREHWSGWSAYPARYRDRGHYARMF